MDFHINEDQITVLEESISLLGFGLHMSMTGPPGLTFQIPADQMIAFIDHVRRPLENLAGELQDQQLPRRSELVEPQAALTIDQDPPGALVGLRLQTVIWLLSSMRRDPALFAEGGVADELQELFVPDRSDHPGWQDVCDEWRSVSTDIAEHDGDLWHICKAVDDAIDAGKLTAAQRDTFMAIGRKNLPLLRAVLAETPALRGSESGAKGAAKSARNSTRHSVRKGGGNGTARAMGKEAIPQ